MARITIGLIFHSDCNQADEIIEHIRRIPNIELVHIQHSYGKLWIKKGEKS